MANNPDSTKQRADAARAGSDGPMSGREVQALLGIEDEGPSQSDEKRPLKMMDLVFQGWGVEAPGYDSEEEEED